jgi:hypothetical protein
MAPGAMTPPSRSVLDRPAARGIAALVFVGCVAFLAWLERDRWLGSEVTASADPAAPCIAERTAQIDGMLAEGLIEAGQAELFKSRAAAMCRDLQGGGSSGPGLPPLPGQ